MITPFLFLLLASFAVGQGLPGKACGDVRCLKPEAKCEDSTQSICECKGNKEGDGELGCHKATDAFCGLLEASRVRNYNQDRVYRLPVPCRYLAAQFDTQKINTNIVCKIRVFAHGERNVDRFFVRGFDAAITKERPSGRNAFAGYRARGILDDVYEYLLEKQDDPEDFWIETAAIDTDDVHFFIEELNSRVVLEVPDCGLKIIFRPEKRSQGRFQTVMPGLTVAVDEQVVEVTWDITSNPVCLSPTARSGGPSKNGIANTLGLPGAEPWAMTYTAFTNVERNTHQTSPCECEDVAKTLRRCKEEPAKLRLAMEKCHFILERPPFVSCIERQAHDSSRVTSLYHECLQGFCKDKSKKCRNVQAAIRARNCQNDADSAFMNHQC